MKATVYRYNTINRADRDYNNTGVEKNPNAIRFYAKTLEYANSYKDVYNKEGEFIYQCELQIEEVDTSNLFDMNENFEELKTYKNFIESQISTMRNGYKRELERAKANNNKRDVELFQGFLDGLVEEEKNIISRLKSSEFQSLSDFDLQNDLVAELTGLGYNGYHTNKEIAIF